MSSIHIGLLAYINTFELPTYIQALVSIVYWNSVAVQLAVFTRWKIRKEYDEPLQKMAEATEEVATGDFSVHLSTIHTGSKMDYLDEMILNFNKMVQELGSIETLKTDFVSNVSHEMKTPIAVIKNASQMLQDPELDSDSQQEYVAVIEESAEKLSTLITNILRLNKLENQHITPETERFDVCENLIECIMEQDSAMEKKNIELAADLDERVYVQADRELLKLVWNNLLSNAIKFSEDGGLIEIRQERNDRNAVICIQDHGLGMNRETASHIFDKFYQGDTSHATEGNGLGLALAVRVLELTGGSIRCESAEGEGSSFYVTLPL